MKNKFLKEVYLNTVNEIISGVPDKYVELIKKEYYNELLIKYSDLDVVEGMYKEAVEGETKDNKEFFAMLSVDERLGFLIEDKYLEFIKQHFFNAKQIAQKVDQGFRYKSFDMDELKKTLNSALDKVYDFNKLRAIKMVDNAIMNYKYVLERTDYKLIN
jgi:hypothetical protein